MGWREVTLVCSPGPLPNSWDTSGEGADNFTPDPKKSSPRTLRGLKKPSAFYREGWSREQWAVGTMSSGTGGREGEAPSRRLTEWAEAAENVSSELRGGKNYFSIPPVFKRETPQLYRN